MVSIRRSHAVLWLAGFGLFFFLALGSSFDLGLVPLALAAAGHFIANVVFGVRTRRTRRYSFDRAWYAAHPESSPEALVEVFADEKRGGEFTLPVRLEAEVSDGGAQRAPFSGSACVGWGIEVELYKSTVLGGDADYTPLEHSSGFDAFHVRYGQSTIAVQPPGVVRGAAAREELLGWTLLDEHPELGRIVDNAMQLQKLVPGEILRGQGPRIVLRQGGHGFHLGHRGERAGRRRDPRDGRPGRPRHPPGVPAARS